MNDKGMRLTIILMTFALASCTREPDSAIVRQVEAAGAGDVRAASNDALLDWFRKHPQVGQETRKLCEPIRKDAPAKWADTTEGRVCQAAQTAAALYFTPRPSDGVGFVPGK
jgi:hypothetical protein